LSSAAARAALAALRLSLAVVSSSVASTWPLVTLSPDSTLIFSTVPDVPKLTDSVRALATEPDADTDDNSVPLDTVVVRASALALLPSAFSETYAYAAPPTSSTPSAPFSTRVLRLGRDLTSPKVQVTA
jgi:hypothetical protein